MSYFDEWIDDYFPDDCDKIRSIGCWSRTATSKKTRKEVREGLSEQGVSQEVIDEFMAGISRFADDPEPVPKLSLQKMLEKINFKSLEVVHTGTGWVGTRYVLHTHNYGSSHPCQTFDELKQWIEKHLGWQLREKPLERKVR